MAGGLAVLAATQPEVSAPLIIIGVLGGTSTAVSGTTQVIGAMTNTDTTKGQEALGAVGTPAGLITTAATGGNLKAGNAASAVQDIVTTVANPKDAVTASGAANLPSTISEASQLVKQGATILK